MPIARVKEEVLRFLGLARGVSHIRVVAGLTAEEARGKLSGAGERAGEVALAQTGGALTVRRTESGACDVSFSEDGTYITTWDGVTYLATPDGRCRYLPAGCEAQTSRPIGTFAGGAK